MVQVQSLSCYFLLRPKAGLADLERGASLWPAPKFVHLFLVPLCRDVFALWWQPQLSLQSPI